MFNCAIIQSANHMAAMWCIQTFTSGPSVNVYMRHVAWDSVLLSVPGALV